jgi:predicted 3-demethylubiquinone-9 3-methyltransferase (glyoxalase superfamily)
MKDTKMTKLNTFLMFEGNANEAIQTYVDLIPGTVVTSMVQYEAGPSNGQVQKAHVSIGGQEVIFIDSPIEHDFTFSNSTSFFLTCDASEQIETLFEGLSQNGSVLMPLAEYPFAEKFTWLNDKFGVSWQLIFNEK